MNKFQIYRQLRRHVKLSESRSALYEQNMIAKVMMMIAFSMVAIYLMFFAVMLSLIANGMTEQTPCQFFFGLMPIMLVVDALVRTLAQRTPAQMVRPYLLLPLRKYDCVDSFIISSIVTPNNLMWLFLTVPFVIMSVLFSSGFFVALAFLVNVQLVFIANSLFFMLCRTLFCSKAWWILLPLAVYGIMFTPLIFGNFNSFFHLYGSLGVMTQRLNPAVFLCFLLLLALMVAVNRRVQYANISAEVMKDRDIQLKTISSFAFFDKFKHTGEYLKLEVKCMLRNKNTRYTFIFSIVFITFISLMNSFTDVYEDGFSDKFWSIYPFVLISVNLVRIMCPEGNYIECLLIRKENIKTLLEAKYYFYSSMLVLPFLLMLPTVFSGKYTLLMLISMMAFTAGPMFCMLMQLAVVNKVSMPLNTKLTRKNGMETNYIQGIVEMVALFMPVGLIAVLKSLMSPSLAYSCILIVSLVFVACHRMWIGNIYRRMMKRKYTNLEGFITSR